jgi:heme exporter protein A
VTQIAPEPNPWAIEAKGVIKSFGPVTALRDVNLRIPYLQSATLLGPNGAGKSTLIRILATLMRPSSGHVWVDGLDVQTWGAEVRRRIGFTAHQTLLYGDLSALQNLRFYGRMYGVDNIELRIRNLLARVELAGRQNDPVRTLSRGMQQRLAIARSLLHDPRILLLDEPFAGLDQRAARILSNLMHELLVEGRTLLMTTHDLQWAAEVSHQVLILSGGRVIHEAPVAGLSAQDLREIYRQHVESRP